MKHITPEQTAQIQTTITQLLQKGVKAISSGDIALELQAEGVALRPDVIGLALKEMGYVTKIQRVEGKVKRCIQFPEPPKQPEAPTTPPFIEAVTPEPPILQNVTPVTIQELRPVTQPLNTNFKDRFYTIGGILIILAVVLFVCYFLSLLQAEMLSVPVGNVSHNLTGAL